MIKKYNFSPGPAALPLNVLTEIRELTTDFSELGVSIMEISHREPSIMECFSHIEQDLRDILNITDDFAVLFLPAGATGQFASIPMSFLNTTADYMITGNWSQKAAVEASIFGKINSIVINPDNTEELVDKINNQADYFYYCSNETIPGLAIKPALEAIKTPIIVDMTSDLMTCPININDFSLIFAGCQKNLGIAGITLVIIKKDFLIQTNNKLPSVLNYHKQAMKKSMYNTPAVFNWYVVGKVLQWIKKEGGVISLYKKNLYKAKILYDYLDNSSFYFAHIKSQKYRSFLNVSFFLFKSQLNDKFVHNAKKNHILGIKGHAHLGGMRASIYNAVSVNDVEYLIDFMDKFAKNNG